MIAESTDFVSSGVVMILALVFLALAVAWLVFPFIVIGKFNDVIRVLRELIKESNRTNELLTRTSRGIESPAEPKSIASTKSEDIPSYRI